MDGNRMELWSHGVELVIAPLALVTCGDLKKNNVSVKRATMLSKDLDAVPSHNGIVLVNIPEWLYVNNCT